MSITPVLRLRSLQLTPTLPYFFRRLNSKIASTTAVCLPLLIFTPAYRFCLGQAPVNKLIPAAEISNLQFRLRLKTEPFELSYLIQFPCHSTINIITDYHLAVASD